MDLGFGTDLAIDWDEMADLNEHIVGVDSARQNKQTHDTPTLRSPLNRTRRGAHRMDMTGYLNQQDNAMNP
jgi:hypothetical protein